MEPVKMMCLTSKSCRLNFFFCFFLTTFVCRIESEDQLDTAKKPGDEKESKDEEDADCKEERGIDMSEDFDSKLQVRVLCLCAQNCSSYCLTHRNQWHQLVV